MSGAVQSDLIGHRSAGTEKAVAVSVVREAEGATHFGQHLSLEQGEHGRYFERVHAGV